MSWKIDENAQLTSLSFRMINRNVKINLVKDFFKFIIKIHFFLCFELYISNIFPTYYIYFQFRSYIIKKETEKKKEIVNE